MNPTSSSEQKSAPVSVELVQELLPDWDEVNSSVVDDELVEVFFSSR